MKQKLESGIYLYTTSAGNYRAERTKGGWHLYRYSYRADRPSQIAPAWVKLNDKPIQSLKIIEKVLGAA